MQRQGTPNVPLEQLGAQIDPEVLAIGAEIVSWRRQLHQHPELGSGEQWTAAFIAQKLRSFGGIEVVEGVGKIGLVGLITGALPGPCIALRADIDALPLQEAKSEFNDKYISQQEGRMHACGHDGHTAMLLATAKILATKRHLMRGQVKLIFQPDEETLSGALSTIKDGVLESGKTGNKVDQIYGLHLMAGRPTGEVQVTDGALMAASDRIRIIIEGPGGHGGMAAGIPDTIVAASHLINQLQTIVSRTVPATDPAVVSICYVHAGDGGYNVLPSRLELRGTIRNFSDDVQTSIRTHIEQLCAGVGSSFNVKVTHEYMCLAPHTENSSKEHVQYVREAAQQVVGKDRTVTGEPVMGAEDFSQYLRRVPGCFFFVGANLSESIPPHNHQAQKDTTAHHSPTFDIDERSLLIGPSIFLNVVKKLMFLPAKL